MFNLATTIEKLDNEGIGPPVINAYGGKSLHEQSQGESFLSLVLHRFGGKGIYILDEPEAALSPAQQFTQLMRAALARLIIKTRSTMNSQRYF